MRFKVIKSKATLLALWLLTQLYQAFDANAQTSTSLVKGIVHDANKEPLIGVSVIIQNNKTNFTSGTRTDTTGVFSTRIPAGGSYSFSFSMVGYESQTLSGYHIKEDTTFSLVVEMKSTTASLDEIVVVGYGTRKRSDVTGAVASVPRERLSLLPVTNTLQAIQGTVAGVHISQGSSVPGSAPTVVIRGESSISASTSPLIVADGVPFNGSINDINPNDIASIDILKDASSTAIYGTRGANGVILITTKRGQTGKTIIAYNGYGGLEDFAHTVRLMGPEQYVQKYADFKAQAGINNTNVLPNAFERDNYAAGITTDWIDEISQQGYIHNHSLRIHGGNKDVRFYVSGDYLKQQGVIKGYQYNRASIRSNLDATITDYLSVGLNLFFTNNNYDGGRAALTLANAMSPYGTLYNADGSYAIYPMFSETLYTSPLLGLYSTRNDRSKNINTNVFAELKPGFVKGLKYTINTAYSYVPTSFQSYVGRKANNLLGAAQVDNTETKNWLIENFLTYEKAWKKHHMNATGLYSAQQTNFFLSSTIATGFINDAISFKNLSSASTTAGASNSYQTNLLSQMLRVHYSYDRRYLFTATARRDGYSAFGSATSKYGFFPSASLGWNISNEHFMKNVKQVGNLKLRVSYGLVGNQAIAPNATATTLANVRLPYNRISTIGIAANVLGNDDLNWESTYSGNVGIDFSILQNKISGTIDAYSTSTKDLLLYRAIPSITGYNRVLANLGKVSNKGVEISLMSQNINNKNFRWESTVNFTTNKNKIQDLYGDAKDDIGNRWFIGHPINVIYDYQIAGVWQAGEDPSGQDPGAKPGDLKFADVDGSKTITPADKVILGQTAPKWYGGLTNTFQYRNFHLNIFIQTAHGVTKYNQMMDFRDLGGRQNLPAEAGYWTAENKSNTRPSLTYTNPRLYAYPQDASYTRIKDVTLSFTAPQRLLDDIKLSGLTIYASGRNLATFTNWVGLDPEADFSRNITTSVATNENNFPLVRSIVFGVNITLR
ncbi:TonB-dependent receptor [Chitinophagaceae bacterium LB-8]|uniref:TonB-dependent receptor n=1 Tax=Paraflavisolibacter caeni TaxID=2982496 RepID=A0A9X2XUT9_9BACT|nr:TonB-dependent receptor [Paraflavisolibacter caeni]MCU7548178.1 TonB-dependent receptor [Paraflavisolibacter caeni]